MSEEQVVETQEEEEKSLYKTPAPKTIDEMRNADEEDEALKKYKAALLGDVQTGSLVLDESNPNRLLVKTLSLVVGGEAKESVDLSKDLGDLKKQTFTIKEGIQYRIKIDFQVQREIVHGLKYVQKTYRKGIQVDKMAHMVGSYPPKADLQSYTTPAEDAPSGLLSRGTYTVKSLFTDDDNAEHLKWEWTFEIKKDW